MINFLIGDAFMSANELDAIEVVNRTVRCSPSDHAILDITVFFHEGNRAYDETLFVRRDDLSDA